MASWALGVGAIWATGAPGAAFAQAEIDAEIEAEAEATPEGTSRVEAEASTPRPGGEVRAAELLARGTALYDRGHYDAALAEYLEAHRALEGHPRQYRVLYNIALCYERSFRYDEAIRYYQRFLDEGGAGGSQAAEVRTVLDALERLLGTVRIVSPLSTLELWIDDHEVAASSDAIRLPAGVHSIEIRAPDHFPARREARVVSGEETVLRIELEAIDAFRGLPSEVFWSSVAVTVATVGAAIGVGIESLADTRTLELRLASEDRWSVTPGEVSSVQNLSLAADVMFAAGGVFAITSLVLGLLTSWSSRAQDQERVGVHARSGRIEAWF